LKIAIVGSRHFSEPERVSVYVNSLSRGASIITGSASGVDAAATKAARAKGIPVQVMPASFDELADAAKSAARNQRLVDACDVLVAFWDGSSKGTRNTIGRALDSGKEVHVFVGGGGGPPATGSRGPQRIPSG
jgi:predicted Rossmann fold nucleotide-binding protein DprA/Smf involved in DNA uptake